jgi:TetR/AcrR family transcriptional repressor of lmrAB and yxaGH operons
MAARKKSARKKLPGPQPAPRERMVLAAVALLSERGLSGTSFSEVIERSGAPRGSIYHHFPEGKQQLTEDAVRWTAERVLAHQRTCPAATPQEVLDWFVGMWRRVVLASGGAAGCVVAGVAVDTDATADAVMAVVRSAFRSWVDLLAEQFTSAGVPRERAESLALATLAGMEGALILCRAERDVAPLDAVAGQLARLLAD